MTSTSRKQKQEEEQRKRENVVPPEKPDPVIYKEGCDPDCECILQRFINWIKKWLRT